MDRYGRDSVEVHFPDGTVRGILAEVNERQRVAGIVGGLTPIDIPGWHFVLLLDGRWFAIATDRAA